MATRCSHIIISMTLPEVSKLATLLFKVGTLAIRTAAKPLANRFQAYVLGHPHFRQQVISAGQYLHKWEVAITRGAEGRTGKYIVGNMSEEKALEIAAKAVSEGFIFTVGVLVIGWDYHRGWKKDQVKKVKDEGHRKEIDQSFREEHEALAELNTRLLGKLEQQAVRLDEVERQLHQAELERMQRSQSWIRVFNCATQSQPLCSIRSSLQLLPSTLPSFCTKTIGMQTQWNTGPAHLGVDQAQPFIGLPITCMLYVKQQAGLF
ncbi:hypothetical protein WJX74_005325 [Apatococcus lobatus]|uniref:Optic atrophy 3 protein n=1 Tax=Apatococcus lobatus TaxID=904363 RepID=A0AAW1R287_9CHLO